ncbi:MAG TPA: hypothetical protein VFG05_00700 [Methylocella sp.]|nr:hypothetical protein [Methylocella sp.]
MNSLLPAIPVIDARESGAVGHAAQSRARASALRDGCIASLPRAMAPLVPALDKAAQRWLSRSCSPYVAEIGEIAATLGFSGIWMLNCSYQWGCTSLAREEEGVPWLARTLDWPFPGLGLHADVVCAQGPAGDYVSVTWPGYAGVLTAIAPGRFAACINQAPMRRRTRHPWLRLYDIAANGFGTWGTVHMPPDQLLRQAFETCATFAAAKKMLESAPVARPVIYTLIGSAPGEKCVIERTETGYVTREAATAAANDWVPGRTGWEARIAAARFFTCTPEEAAGRCEARRSALAQWPGRLAQGRFEWVLPPVLNPYTRLAVVMSPGAGVLRAVGFEMTDSGLPQEATRVCDLSFGPAARGAIQVCHA